MSCRRDPRWPEDRRLRPPPGQARWPEPAGRLGGHRSSVVLGDSLSAEPRLGLEMPQQVRTRQAGRDREGRISVVDHVLQGTRVVEIADEQAEYVGLVLAGLGAEVLKVEPPDGNPTRRIGPFYEDVPDAERSLFFWHYNRGKRSISLDLDAERDRATLLDLLGTAQIFLESTPNGYLRRLGLDPETLRQRFPSLIIARVSPFGDVGPWAGLQGLGPRSSRPWRRDDELRLRSAAGRDIRPAANRSADVARLPHNRREPR